MLYNTLLWMVATLYISACTARPGFLHDHHHHLDYHPTYVHHEPLAITKYVHLPATAVSHHSSTIIHATPIIKPIIVPSVIKTVVPIIKTYHTAPIIKTLHYDPFYHHYDHGYHHH